jgi:hypothetical protein
MSGSVLVQWRRAQRQSLLPSPIVSLLVDWKLGAGHGNPLFDLLGWLPSMHAEGGPEPWTVHKGEPAMVTALAGFFAVRAGQPPQGAPHPQLQLNQLKASAAVDHQAARPATG